MSKQPGPDSADRADLETWQALATEDLRGKDPESLVGETPDGIRIKPLYTAADLEALELVDTLPGVFPFLRGPHADVVAHGSVSAAKCSPAA